MIIKSTGERIFGGEKMKAMKLDSEFLNEIAQQFQTSKEF